MNRRPGYSPEVRERAVRLVLTTEHEHKSRWAATQSVATKIGCTLETLRTWINKISDPACWVLIGFKVIKSQHRAGTFIAMVVFIHKGLINNGYVYEKIFKDTSGKTRD